MIFSIKTDIPRTYLKNELLSSRFTLSSLRDYIDGADTHIELEHFNIKMHVIYHSSQFIPRLLLKRVINRLYLVSQQFQIHKNIIYWFLPIEENRLYPRDGTPVTPNSINGGYTYPRENEIFVYRYEDFAKVMIHELLHHSIIESKTEWTQAQLDNLRYYFNISKECKVLPNEALVETWATYLQLQFISKEYNIPFKKLYDLECQWGLQQSYRLLSHKNKLNKAGIWHEETNSFTYIVFKTILLVNLKKFLKIKMPYNSIDIYNFILKHRNIQVYKNKNKSMRISLFGNI